VRRSMSLESLALEVRWVAWRNEPRGKKYTKVPYAPNGGRAKAHDAATWGTRSEAEARAKKLVDGHGGGIGIELGDLGGGVFLGGIDLDSCIADDGALASWAVEILRAVSSYTERSRPAAGLSCISTRLVSMSGRSLTELGCSPMPGALAEACRGKTGAIMGLQSKFISPAGISPLPRTDGQVHRTGWPRSMPRHWTDWRR